MAESGKSFIKNFVGFSISTWVSFIISFLAAPIGTRLFDPDVLGRINIFNTYVNLFGVFVLAGLDQAFARFYYERPNNKSIRYLFSFCLAFTYSVLLLLMVISLPCNEFLSVLLFKDEGSLLYYLFFISIWCTSTLRYLNLSYRMEKDIKLFTIQGVLIALVSKFLYLGVGYWNNSYRMALIVLTASHFVLTVVFLIIQHNRFERIKQIDKMFSAEMFKYALPLLPVSFFMWANSSIPQIVIQNTMDYTSVGIFTTAVALANVILVIQAGFNTFWVPYSYENYKTQTGQFFKVHRYLLCVITILALFVILSQDVIFLLLGEKYRAAKHFFPFLMLGPICYIIGETTGIGIEISKKTYLKLIVYALSIVINIALCFFLKDFFGVAGVAIATALAAVSAMVLKTYYGEKYYKSIESYRYMFFSIMVLIIGSTLSMLINDNAIRIITLLAVSVLSGMYFHRELRELFAVAKSYFYKNN